MRALLGATDDFDSDKAREVLTAEPAFMPPEQIALPPGVQPQPSLSGLTVTEDHRSGLRVGERVSYAANRLVVLKAQAFAEWDAVWKDGWKHRRVDWIWYFRV